MIALASPSRTRPAWARMIASRSCSSSLRSRVSTLPRMSTSRRSGRRCKHLRPPPQAARGHRRAPAGNSSKERCRLRNEHVAGRAARRHGRQRRVLRPASVGRSFRLWTATSTAPVQQRSLDFLGEDAVAADLRPAARRAPGRRASRSRPAPRARRASGAEQSATTWACHRARGLPRVPMRRA